MTYDPIFVSQRQAAKRLGLPSIWLGREAAAGRIPSLDVGKGQLMFNVDRVKDALIGREKDLTASTRRVPEPAPAPAGNNPPPHS